MTAPLRYEIEASVVAPGVSEARPKGSAVRFDTSAGQSAELPGPAELLATAFTACVLKNVERFSELLPFAYDGAWIRVTAERQQTPPRFTKIHYELHLETTEPPRRVELLQRNLASFGTVYNALASSCEVTGVVVAEQPVKARTQTATNIE
jgi:uncharacterized OsmC-like protein